MLRNDLINLMAQYDNDNVAVDVNGFMVDVKTVTAKGGSVVIQLDPEGLGRALDWVMSNRAAPTMTAPEGDNPL